MITIDVEFYDKKTEFIADEIRLEVPDEMVFDIVEKENPIERENISYINSRPFRLSESMKEYVIKKSPETKNKFHKYSHAFIGRHGLGEGY